MEHTNETCIQIDRLDVRFQKKHILKGICCEMPKHKITAIIGESGCGKSTLLKSINRIVEEEGGRISGEIRIHDENSMDMPKEQLRKQVGLVFQTPAIFPTSIKQNMRYPLGYHYKLNAREQQEKIAHYLNLAGLYDEIKADLNMSAAKLSGGQKQRLSIARCLCIEPDILMLDEPCSALDMRNTILIENLLCQLKQSISIVLVTHNISQAKRITDHVLFLEAGSLVETNNRSIFEHPKEDATRRYMQYMDE